MKKLFSLLLVAALMFSLVACGGDKKEEAKDDATGKEQEQKKDDEKKDEEKKDEEKKDDEKKDEEKVDADKPLVVATAEFNGDFYRGWTNATYDDEIRELVWGYGLLDFTKEGEIIDSPLLAEKEVSDDLLTWTFKLKDGLTFSNGEELTASDVKFTYDFYMDTEALGKTGGTSTLGDYVDTIEVDEANNSATFKMKKATYTMDFDVFEHTYIFPEDTIKKGAEAAGQTVQEYVKTNISSPIGYGPYKLDEYKEAEYCKLSAFDGTPGPKPNIKNIIVKVTPSETEMDQLLQGEVDVLTGQVEAEKIDVAKDEANNLSYNNYYRHGGGTVILHTDFGPTQLTEVRQAFAYVFNRPKVIELFLGEYGLSSNGPYSKQHWMMYDDDEMDKLGTAENGRFEDSLISYDILDADGKFDEDANIAKAHELLDAAVAKTDGEYAKLTGDAKSGYMWDGAPLEIKITYTEFWSDTYNLVWNDKYVEKLGFKVSLNGLDWPVMYDHWTGASQEERQYNAFVGGISYNIKSNPITDYATNKIKEWGVASDNGPRFTGGNTYTPEEWDALLKSIEDCNPLTDRDKYRANWRKYVETFNKEVPIIPVYANNYHDIYVNTLENFETNAIWTWTKGVLYANWK